MWIHELISTVRGVEKGILKGCLRLVETANSLETALSGKSEGARAVGAICPKSLSASRRRKKVGQGGGLGV